MRQTSSHSCRCLERVRATDCRCLRYACAHAVSFCAHRHGRPAHHLRCTQCRFSRLGPSPRSRWACHPEGAATASPPARYRTSLRVHLPLCWALVQIQGTPSDITASMPPRPVSVPLLLLLHPLHLFLCIDEHVLRHFLRSQHTGRDSPIGLVSPTSCCASVPALRRGHHVSLVTPAQTTSSSAALTAPGLALAPALSPRRAAATPPNSLTWSTPRCLRGGKS